MLLLLAAGGCSTAGDLGRAKPGVAYELAYSSSTKGGTAETDEEREMYDRVWRFMRTPTQGAWGDSKVDLDNSPRDGYFHALIGTKYQSSHIRYRTIAYDADIDVELLPGVFDSICTVREMNRRRGVALDGPGMEPEVFVRAEEQRSANELAVARFVTALRFRFDSYDYALNHLLVETPHEEALEANASLNALAVWVEEAEDGNFCGGQRILQSAGRDRRQGLSDADIAADKVSQRRLVATPQGLVRWRSTHHHQKIVSRAIRRSEGHRRHQAAVAPGGVSAPG